jgi:aldehyde:ferredoxin oxidoreductase
MLGGYMGKLLFVDLGSKAFHEEVLDEGIARKYIGGTGLATYLMNKYPISDYHALDPKSPLMFMTGPLTGTRVPQSGRLAIIAKSPLTGIWGDSDVGCNWGISLKEAGYDGLIVTGKSDEPIYLQVSDSGVDFCDAKELWGTDTYHTHETLQNKHSEKASVLCIGQAGERQILMANIMAEGIHARAAGRCGLGAVMGSKNLKAIVASGTQKPKIAHSAELKESIKRIVPILVKKGQRLKKLGTAGGVVGNASIGDMSAKNWTIGDWIAGAEKISGERMAEEYTVKNFRCPNCVIACGKTVKITRGDFKGTVAGGPEYETLAGFGSQVLIEDLAVILEANDLCNRAGIDTISLGVTIAFLYEAKERGYIDFPDSYPKSTWGDSDTLIFLINETINQRGLGVLIGKGVKRFSEYLGGKTKDFAMHVKGLEFPFHDPRALGSLAVSYATYGRGACHRGCTHNLERSAFPQLGYPSAIDRHATEGKGKAAAIMQNYSELFNCLKICNFIIGSVQPTDILEWLNLVTGWDMDLDEFLEVGERTINQKRLINLKCGVIPEKDDTIPARILKEPFPKGNSANYLPDLPAMIQDYYNYRGWDQSGKPSSETLARLGLEEAAQY